MYQRARIALYHSPEYQTSFESIGISAQEKFKMDFQDGSHLGFLNEMILAIFALQVALILPIKFRGNWPFTSGKEVQDERPFK